VILLLVHAAATWFMVGLVWFVQLVHYPLFAGVGRDGFVAYEDQHSRRTTAAIAVPWPVEGLTTAALLVWRPAGVPLWMPVAGAVAFAGLVLATLLLQVPAHQRLGDGFDPRTHRRLVSSNWIRTVLWSTRGVLALWMLAVAA
jgi:hypothetical protein